MPVNDPFSGMFVLAGLMFVAFFVFAYFSKRARDKRARRLEEWATSQGWRYLASDPSLVTLWKGPPFVGHGSATDVISGQLAGHPFTAFTYTYKEGSGDDERTYRYFVTGVRLPSAMPMLSIAPETVSRRLMKRFGSQDIDFESVAFNNAFTVQADDERYAYAVVHPRMMEYLLGSSLRHQGIRIHGDTALTWTVGELELEGVQPMVSDVARFVDLIPRHAVQQHAVEPAPSGYAGSVSGVRPEATSKQLWRSGFLILFGVVWCAITLPVIIGFSRTWNRFGSMGSPFDMFPTTIFAFFPLIGVAVALGGVVQLIRGVLAVRRNKRDRERRLNGPQAE